MKTANFQKIDTNWQKKIYFNRISSKFYAFLYLTWSLSCSEF